MRAIYEYTTRIQILMLHEFPCHPAAGEGLPMPSRSAQIALAALHVKKLPKQQEPPLCPEEKLQLQKNKLILIRPHYTHTVYESKLVDLWSNIILGNERDKGPVRPHFLLQATEWCINKDLDCFPNCFEWSQTDQIKQVTKVSSFK